MNKIILSALIATSVTMMSCQSGQNKSDKTSGQEAEKQSVVDLNTEITNEAMGIYVDFCKAERNIANMTIIYDEAKMNDEILMPVSCASKGQTRIQYAKLLGAYTADAFIEKVYLCNNEAAQKKYEICAKLYADLNIGLTLDSIEAMVQLSNKDYLVKRGLDMSEDFRQTLESGDADIHLMTTNYFNIEMNNFFENCPVAADQWKEQPGAEDSAVLLHSHILRLYNVLAPYYESMQTLKPLAEKLQAIEDAENKTKALQEYRTFCCEMRKNLENEMK